MTDRNRHLAVHDPATGEVVAEVADHGPDQAIERLGRVVAGGHRWRAEAPERRAEVLRGAAGLLRRDREALAALVTAESGKPLAEARGEVDYAAGFLDWYAQEAVRADGRLGTNPAGTATVEVHRVPLGPCLLVTPWNFPLAMPARKIAPALAAGNTAVLKPAEAAPLATLALLDRLREAGCPPDAAEVVTTSRPAAVVDALLRSGQVRKLSFTGSTAVGRLLAASAGAVLARTSMELGGNAPFVVFDDADLDRAGADLLVAKLRNTGQACTAVNRVLVQEGVADELVERVVDAVARLRVGPGAEPTSDLGPLTTEAGRDKVARLVEAAVVDGAEVRLPGGPRPGAGTFHDPVVLDRVPVGHPILTTEVFGPVVSFQRFGDDAEGLALADDTDAALVAYVQSRRADRLDRACASLRFGMIAVNRALVSEVAAPFGGVRDAGHGREGGPEGLADYQDLRYVTRPWPGPPGGGD